MKKIIINRIHVTLSALVLFSSLTFPQPAGATPFGQGVFGADIPFGSMTSLSIALSGNVSVNLAPNGSIFEGTGTSTVTVTSTDAVGYKLYAYSPSSNTMVNGSDSIPASNNSSPAPLSVNTWGYNTNGSANYLGMLTTPSLIKDASGPYKSGDSTTITYKALTNITKGAGNYTVGVVYTATPAHP